LDSDVKFLSEQAAGIKKMIQSIEEHFSDNSEVYLVEAVMHLDHAASALNDAADELGK
jgi:hypothetical protein